MWLTAGQYGGTGAGLVVARRLIELRRAELVARSEPRLLRGSTGEGAAPVASRPDPSAVGRGQRILVVEDAELCRMLVVLLLEQLGCEVDVAANGLEAVRCVDHQHYECVFMDCQMPELDGFEATRQIRRHEAVKVVGPGRRLPIVALTANPAQCDRARCLEAGMDDYLQKPVDFESLAQALARWTGWAGHAHGEGQGVLEAPSSRESNGCQGKLAARVPGQRFGGGAARRVLSRRCATPG